MFELDWLYPSDAYQWYSQYVTKYRKDKENEMVRVPLYFLRKLTFCDNFSSNERTSYFEKVRDAAFSFAE